MIEDIVQNLQDNSPSDYNPLFLGDIESQTYDIPEGFSVETHYFSNDYKKEIKAVVESLVDKAEMNGHGVNLTASLYETILNAYQHGNQRDPSKAVTIAYDISQDAAEFAVIDEGGELHPDFGTFVQMHRENVGNGSFLNFYELTGKEQSPENLGTGTSFMHAYSDVVKYFKSKTGGLAVQLVKFAEGAQIATDSGYSA